MTQITGLAAYGKQYTKDNPDDVLGFIQSNNPHYIGKTHNRKFYRIGYRVTAQTVRLVDGQVRVFFTTTSDHFPKFNGLSVTLKAKEANIVAVRKSVKLLKVAQVKQALERGE